MSPVMAIGGVIEAPGHHLRRHRSAQGRHRSRELRAAQDRSQRLDGREGGGHQGALVVASGRRSEGSGGWTLVWDLAKDLDDPGVVAGLEPELGRP